MPSTLLGGRFAVCVLTFALLGPAVAFGQTAGGSPETAQPDLPVGPQAAGWHFMQDGSVFANLNAQDDRRGQTEFIVQNWWMAMLMRARGRHQLNIEGMVSLDPATVGKDGYSAFLQIFPRSDTGPLLDRQHPHELLMQASLVWRYALTGSTAITLGGGPVGEPALGPISYLHRPSAIENPAAPLSHHMLDETHASMGVLNAGLSHGPWAVEASLFNARGGDAEPWDLYDPGPLDSWSSRVWFEPGNWQVQASHGVLKETHMGDLERSTLSLGFFRPGSNGYWAAFVAAGQNRTADGDHDAILVEASRKSGLLSLYGRIESAHVHANELLGLHHQGAHSAGISRVGAFTAGAVVAVVNWRGVEGAIGGDITAYALPEELKPSYGSRPLSFHLFFRVRPPSGPMGRMWNARMSKPMTLTDPHAGHLGGGIEQK